MFWGDGLFLRGFHTWVAGTWLPPQGSPSPLRGPQTLQGSPSTKVPLCPIRPNSYGGEKDAAQHPKIPPYALVLGAATPILGLPVAEQSSQGCKPVAFPALHRGIEFFGGINNQFEGNWGFLGGCVAGDGGDAVPPANHGVDGGGKKASYWGEAAPFWGPLAGTRHRVGYHQHLFLQGESDGTRCLAQLRDTENFGGHSEALRPLGFPAGLRPFLHHLCKIQPLFLIFSSFISYFL